MNKFIIGIDGGGTKTKVALADLSGKIIKEVDGAPSNLRNLGVNLSCKNIIETVSQIDLKNKEIVSVFVGLPAFEEEYSEKETEIKERLSVISKNIYIGSDQLVAFLSGTDSDTGIVLIAGTGAVSKGFKDGKEYKASGWGYFGDEGSAFWTGIEAYRAITADLDGRSDKTIMTDMIFDKWSLKSGNGLNKMIYNSPTISIPQLSIVCDYADKKGDKIANEILKRGAIKLFVSAKKVIDVLELKNESFDIVIIGGMLKSETFFKTLVFEIKNYAKNSNIIIPTNKPVYGAVKLAIKKYEQN